MNMATSAAAALRHLGLTARPVRVDEYGYGPRAMHRVAVDCGRSIVVVAVDAAGVRTMSGEAPRADADTFAEALAAGTAAALACRPAAGESAPSLCCRIETALSALSPAAATFALAEIETWFGRDIVGDFRADVAARRGFERANGADLASVVPVEEREANRARSMAAQAEISAAAKAMSAERGYWLGELADSMAAFARGQKRGAQKLRRAIDKARDFAADRRPYLTDDARDGSPNAVYSKYAAMDRPSPKKDEYEVLLADWRDDDAAARRQIADAEAMLTAAATA